MQEKALEVLNQYFGYTSFRKGQKEIIDEIFKNRDVLGLMPTGAGKSLCYQVPALVKEGTAIIISPLISLMKDQVDSLNEMGVPAAFINSSLNVKELRDIFSKAKDGKYKLIYIAPERLESEGFFDLLMSIDVSFIAVDEAHCVSQWGHDFRPSYTRIINMINSFKKRPVVTAFTATATPRVKDDIIKLLGLKNPYVQISGFDRENLYFKVVKPIKKFDYLLEFIKKNKGNSGIVYCSTRKFVEQVCDKLKAHGINAVRYHAGLSDTERTQNQEDFIYDHATVIVATNAFGMGIDKSNVRYVVHYNMPKTMENYYQEAGRAGRDGERSECILLFNGSDIITNKFLIENSGENADKAGDYKKLQDMIDYCNEYSCLRGFILKYFGEDYDKQECDNCGNCDSDIEKTNIKVEAQKIISCIKRMGEKYGSGVVCNVLRGGQTEVIKAKGFDNLSTYGIMKEFSEKTIKEMISFLTSKDFLKTKGDRYPVLTVANEGLAWLKSGEDLLMQRSIAMEKDRSNSKHQEIDVDMNLFEKLRELRRDVALKERVPPYMIFSDVSLKDMCKRIPFDEDAMLKVSGVGQFKMNKYGKRFLSLIKEYAELNNLLPQAVQKPKKEKLAINSTGKDSKLVTYELYKDGKTIEDICKARELARSTIEGHLFECIELGMELDSESLIPKEFEEAIMNAIENVGTEKLKPIKEILPPEKEISYSQIKFCVGKYNKQHE